MMHEIWLSTLLTIIHHETNHYPTSSHVDICLVMASIRDTRLIIQRFFYELYNVQHGDILRPLAPNLPT